MKRRTLGALLASSLLAATAAMAIPVTPDPARDSSADTIQFGWHRTSGANEYIDQTWWAVRDRCTPGHLGERLLCDAVAFLARAATRTFEAKMSDEAGLVLPAGWGLMTAKNSPFIRSAHVETPRDLAAVLAFYRAALRARGWTEIEGAEVTPESAAIRFTTSEGPASLRLSRQDGKTIADLSLRKPAVASAGILPKPGQARLLLGNKTDEAAVITVNERTIPLAAHAGETLAYSGNVADELPDDLKIDLPPGKYKLSVKVDGHAQVRQFEVAFNETWGFLVGPDGALLPIRLY
ncbi:hypothetical protein LPJ38_26195 [Bradyrhizobium daqingense]|uniref:PEGA domain-containing protein n=1 Tax=Bradyrhizobium daqingense TaxID=993502 RepID=A0A562KSV8_9BRAD|nr:hypothetical protein [Bradyrhizobium daqingense]TWH98509.1 hypothetical protein IQ17_05967 [Bradyrhizobium daqingense]UFS87127.1 hypothetical protein LPJ38_26195 [Bradyrhizobium daqingense]